MSPPSFKTFNFITKIVLAINSSISYYIHVIFYWKYAIIPLWCIFIFSDNAFWMTYTYNVLFGFLFIV